MITSTHSRRFLSLLAVLAAVIAVPSVASAASGNCGKQVIGDWYDNGRVDELYPLHCYEDAIDQIPKDLLDYGSAKDDILRALAFAKRGQNDPGDTTGQPTTSTPTTETGSTTTTQPAPTTTTETGTTDETETLTEAVGPGEDDDPSSVPLPLIILGGLAVLLAAAGVAGYIARRRQDGPGAGADPPAPV